MAQKDRHSGNLSPEFALLGFLIPKPSHGYDLHQHFQIELGHVWHLSQSQAYAILKRLEQHGDISTQVVAQEKLPARQLLRITVQGRRRFNEWLDEVSLNARSIRLEFLTRIYFARIHNPEKVAQLYDTQYDAIQATLERLETLLTNLPLEQQFNRLSLDLRIRQMKLIQEWIKDVKAQLSSFQE